MTFIGRLIAAVNVRCKSISWSFRFEIYVILVNEYAYDTAITVGTLSTLNTTALLSTIEPGANGDTQFSNPP